MTKVAPEELPRYAALACGGFYLLFGILSLLPPLHEAWPIDGPTMTVRNGRGVLFGVFPNNLVTALMHLSIGLCGLLLARSPRPAWTFMRSATVVFWVIAILGLLPWVDSLAGVIPTFGAIAVLHTVTAVALSTVVIVARPPATASKRGNARVIDAALAHSFLSVFPLGFLAAVPASDLAHWWTTMDWYRDYDGFWATSSLWLIGIGLAGGALCTLTGLMDLRHRGALTRQSLVTPHVTGSAVALLLSTVNLLLRVTDHDARVVPWGIVLSLVVGGVIVYHGWYVGARSSTEDASR